MAFTIALVGGTGPEGRGLATRFAMAGHTVLIGSRDRARAATAAIELSAALPPGSPQIVGAENRDAVERAGIVVLAVPFEAQAATLEGLAVPLEGKIVIDAVVPVRFERGPRPVDVPEGSATEQAAARLPRSRVVGAFHTVAAAALADPNVSLHEDVLVTGDDADAKLAVCALVDSISGLRSVDAGPLRFSRFVEGITIMLIGVNGRYKAHAGIRVEGLPQ